MFTKKEGKELQRRKIKFVKLATCPSFFTVNYWNCIIVPADTGQEHTNTVAGVVA